MSNTQILIKYFPELTEYQIQQFNSFYNLFAHWNASINLISRKDMDDFFERHVLHSLAIAKVIAFQPGQRVLDIGTGGGFPGIPLAIFYPETHFVLVDSIAKKIKVVNDVIQQMQLINTQATNARAEQIEGKFNYVTNRAVAPLNKLWGWSKSKIINTQNFKGALISLKGGDLSEEIQDSKKKVEVHEISKYFDEPFFETKKVLITKI